MSVGGGPILALDSSTAMGSVAVGAAGEVLAEISLIVRGGHSSALMPAIDYAMRSAGVKASDLAGVVVGAGPGSFTGLRIAGATAKGVVHALGIPLFAYSSLLATAAPFAGHEGVIGALFDARGRDVFAACYRFGSSLQITHRPSAMTLDDAIEQFRIFGVSMLVGEGAGRHAKELQDALGAPMATPQVAWPRGSALVWLAEQFPDQGRVSAPEKWEPDYLRPSGAERIAAARASAASEEAAR